MIWLLICLVKKINPIVTGSFIRGKKHLSEVKNISLVFLTQSDFAVPENIRLNSTHYIIMKILNKQEIQQIAFNHLSDIDFMNLHKNVLQSQVLF